MIRGAEADWKDPHASLLVTEFLSQMMVVLYCHPISIAILVRSAPTGEQPSRLVSIGTLRQNLPCGLLRS